MSKHTFGDEKLVGLCEEVHANDLPHGAKFDASDIMKMAPDAGGPSNPSLNAPTL